MRQPRPLFTIRAMLIGVSASVAGHAMVVCAGAADEPAGKAIYARRCAECHGENGEGVADLYAQPLVGDKSLVELTRVIERTMPDGEPDECTGTEAERVAKYVYDAFYSRVAQARNRPPRIALSRLTVRQYENAIADLLGSFENRPALGDERGLEAEYYADRRTRRDKRVAERRDPVVDFDFGEGVPIEEKMEPEAFAIRWRGSVVAPETGEYEFVLRTENGARLDVNGQRVVDRWVKSGDEIEHRGRIRLLGGRAYPLELEFFTFKEPTASIRLEWKRPHHVTELVPERALSPQRVPETFVVTTPFPPDDASEGYERGTSVSRAWDEATTRAAIEVAQHVVKVSGAENDTPEDKLREFCRTFASRAFRRPLSDAEAKFFVDRQFDEAANPVTAVKRVVILTLKSPRFLYREPDGPFDDFDVASWLAFCLWDSIPDEPLLQAAGKGELRTREQIAAQAERMVADPRARQKLTAFFEHWLRLGHFPEIAKDDALYPEFDEQLLSDLRTSLELGVEDWLQRESPDLRELLLGESLFANERIAGFYGLDVSDDLRDTQFEPVDVDSPRVGILSHPYLLAGFAYDSETSPIHRGVFLARSVLGRRLRPPPEAVTPLPPDLHPDLTTRERVELQTKPDACRSCHDMINPLGFPLEQFDAVGRYREKEGTQPVDASGHYLDRSGEEVEFVGVPELAAYLAGSGEVHEAFAEQLFQYAVKQPVQAFGPERLAELRSFFAESGYDVRKLAVEIAVSSALHRRK